MSNIPPGEYFGTQVEAPVVMTPAMRTTQRKNKTSVQYRGMRDPPTSQCKQMFPLQVTSQDT